MTGGATPPQGAVGVSEYPAALSLSSGPSTPAASTASSAPSAGSWGCFALFSLIEALLVRLRRSRHHTSPLFSMVADRRTAEKGKKHGPPRVRQNPFSHRNSEVIPRFGPFPRSGVRYRQVFLPWSPRQPRNP